MLFQLVILALIVLAKSEESIEINESGSPVLRLPNNTKPLWYDIHLSTKIHIGEANYSGVVSIKLQALEDSNKIVIHCGAEIEIKKINLISQDENIEFENVTYDRNNISDFLSIYSEPNFQLKEGQIYTLTLSFNGVLTDYAHGFFRSFRGEENKDVWIAATFFEPVYARNAFPCYDEPALKAQFSIALTHGANYTALSNMPADGDLVERENDMVTTKFMTTPLMSTYAVAFVVGNYNSISTKIKNITCRVFSEPSDNYNGEFALNISSKALHLCEDYFETEYPLPKMDHISVWGFPAGAMENWGLIIHNDEYLLKFSNTSELSNLRTAVVIVHETVHQWFGNLITPKWWNYAWLSEGITSFYTVKILQMLHPEWKSTEQELYKCGEFSNEPEGLFMSQYVESEFEIWMSFRRIFYCKGFKIMRMFEHALTSETFKKGILKYLKKYQFSAVEESYLFACLQEAATDDKIPVFGEEGMVHKIMSSWTRQTDYPLLTVERDYNTGLFGISQRSVQDNNEEKQAWWIPITFATSSKPDFDDTTTDFILPAVQNYTINPSEFNKTLSSTDWLILNKQQIGMYRVMYDDNNWNLIIKTLKENPKMIPSYSKAQLLRDAGDLDAESILPSKILFNLLSYLENEDEMLPWMEGIRVMRRILDSFSYAKGVEYFKYFARNIVKNVYRNITAEPNSRDTTLTEAFRSELLRFFEDIEMNVDV